MLIDLKNLSNLYIAHGNLTTYNNHIVPAPRNLSPQVKHCRLMKGDKQKKMSKFLKDEIVPAVTSYFMYSEIQGSALIEKSAFIIGEKPEVPESILVVAAVVNLVRFIFCQIIVWHSVEEMVFCYQNCSNLVGEKIVLVLEKTFEIRGGRLKICKTYEINTTTCLNSERSEPELSLLQFVS